MELLHCPHCRTPLRLRNRPTKPLRVQCPDCQSPLEIIPDDDEGLVARLDGQKPLHANSPSAPSRPIAVAAIPLMRTERWTTRTPQIFQRLTDPLIVTWTAASIAAISLAIAFIQAGRSSPPAPAAASQVPSNRVDREPEAPITPVESSQTPQEPSQQSPVLTDSAEQVPASPQGQIQNQPPLIAEKPVVASHVDPRDLIREHLVQRFVRFEQSTSVPFDTLRLQLEELSGVPIRYDDRIPEDSASRNQSVQITLDDVTIAHVLEEAARQANLHVLVVPDGLLLVTASSAKESSNRLATEL